MRTFYLAARAVCLGACLVAFGSCGDKGPAVGSVSGVITYKSKPVTRASVVFENPARGWIEVAEVDGDGHYDLPSVRVGEYTVSIQPPEQELPAAVDGGSIQAMREASTAARISDPMDIPRVVRKTQTSPLKAMVVKGGQEIDFELSGASQL